MRKQTIKLQITYESTGNPAYDTTIVQRDMIFTEYNRMMDAEAFTKVAKEIMRKMGKVSMITVELFKTASDDYGQVPPVRAARIVNNYGDMKWSRASENGRGWFGQENGPAAVDGWIECSIKKLYDLIPDFVANANTLYIDAVRESAAVTA